MSLNGWVGFGWLRLSFLEPFLPGPRGTVRSGTIILITDRLEIVFISGQ